MPVPHLVYYLFLIVSFVCAYLAARKEARFSILSILLSLSILTEIIVDVLKTKKIECFIIYHVYIPVEYAFLAMFFSQQHIGAAVRRFILISIPAFIIASLLLSLFVIRPPHFPSVQFNLEGLFVIVISVYTLFTIEVDTLKPFYTFPIFWICSGLILFHAGLFLFNGAYNYLLSQETEQARYLHTLINTNLQYLLYLFWIIGFLWPLRKKSFITH